MSIILNRKGGLVKIIVLFRGYGRCSLNQAMIENEWLTTTIFGCDVGVVRPPATGI